jgi:hypothetical protein
VASLFLETPAELCAHRQSRNRDPSRISPIDLVVGDPRPSRLRIVLKRLRRRAQVPGPRWVSLSDELERAAAAAISEAMPDGSVEIDHELPAIGAYMNGTAADKLRLDALELDVELVRLPKRDRPWCHPVPASVTSQPLGRPRASYKDESRDGKIFALLIRIVAGNDAPIVQ